MDIFSKRDGPRAEDVRAKKLIQDNAGTIRKLADQISNGGFSQMRAEEQRRTEGPKPKGLMIHDLKAKAALDDVAPYVRVSPNNRVVLVDMNTNRQLHLLGEIRGNFQQRHFVIATKDNGFFSPLPEELTAAIQDLAGKRISNDFSEQDLAQAIEVCFDLKGG